MSPRLSGVAQNLHRSQLKPESAKLLLGCWDSALLHHPEKGCKSFLWTLRGDPIKKVSTYYNILSVLGQRVDFTLLGLLDSGTEQVLAGFRETSRIRFWAWVQNPNGRETEGLFSKSRTAAVEKYRPGRRKKKDKWIISEGHQAQKTPLEMLYSTADTS